MLDACWPLHTAHDVAGLLPTEDSSGWLPVRGKELETWKKTWKSNWEPREVLFAIHICIWSETKVFITKERNKRNLQTPMWKANRASPDPNLIMFIRCFHDSSTLPCAQVNSLYHKVGEFTVNPCLLFPRKVECVILLILWLSVIQLIFVFLREPARESWQVPWTCLLWTLTLTGIIPW